MDRSMYEGSPPKLRSEVESLVTKSDELVETINKAIMSIEMSLNMVLRPDGPIPASETIKVSSTITETPLTGMLNNHNNRLEHTLRNLETLHQRIVL
jgi:hypothetical protein